MNNKLLYNRDFIKKAILWKYITTQFITNISIYLFCIYCSILWKLGGLGPTWTLWHITKFIPHSRVYGVAPQCFVPFRVPALKDKNNHKVKRIIVKVM